MNKLRIWKLNFGDALAANELIAEIVDDPDKAAYEIVGLRQRLLDTAEQLDAWAAESVRGGWSTHQVRPMRDLAFSIRVEVGT